MDCEIVLDYGYDPSKVRILVRRVDGQPGELPSIEVIANQHGMAALAQRAAAFVTDPEREDLMLGPGPEDGLLSGSLRLVFTFDASLDRKVEV
ncbi:MAG TPA: hypothetical protein VGN26_06185 [Armatimonadota bacterium]|jgi:hypothetical protein